MLKFRIIIFMNLKRMADIEICRGTKIRLVLFHCNYLVNKFWKKTQL